MCKKKIKNELTYEMNHNETSGRFGPKTEEWSKKRATDWTPTLQITKCTTLRRKIDQRIAGIFWAREKKVS